MSTGGEIDLSSCVALENLVLSLTPHFSMDTHAGFVKHLISSWKPQGMDPDLILHPHRERMFTRQVFSDIMRGLGTIIETLVQTVEEPHPSGESGNNLRAPYGVHFVIHDWDSEETWWEDHLESCFPTWEQLGKLSWDFETRESTLNNRYSTGLKILCSTEHSRRMG